MKLIFNLIKIAFIFVFMAVAFVILINKTFIYETYSEVDMKGEGIPISRFMYFTKLSSDLNANFISPLNAKYLEKYKEDYLNDLEFCYGKYYYDESNDITILNYNILDNDYYRTINIKYAYDNYCSDDYILSDMWVYEYNTISKYVKGDIESNKMNDLILKVYESTRINNPVIDDNYESQTSIEVICAIEDETYTLTFKDFNVNQLLIVKNYRGVSQFAVYEIDNVSAFLESLMN